MHVEFELERKAFGYNFGNSFERGILAARFARSGFTTKVGKEKPGYEVLVLVSDDFNPEVEETYAGYYTERANILADAYRFTITKKEILP